MILQAKQPTCAEGVRLAPFTLADLTGYRGNKKLMANCNQCKKYRCKVEVEEKGKAK